MGPLNERQNVLSLNWEADVEVNDHNNDSDDEFLLDNDDSYLPVGGDSDDTNRDSIDLVTAHHVRLNIDAHWYAKFLVHPVVTIVVFILMPVISVGSGGLTYYYRPVLNTSDPIEGFQTKHTSFVGKFNSLWLLAHHHTDLSYKPDPDIVAENFDLETGAVCGSSYSGYSTPYQEEDALYDNGYETSRPDGIFDDKVEFVQINDVSKTPRLKRSRSQNQRRIYELCYFNTEGITRDSGSVYKLVFEPATKGDNLFTAQNLRAICDLEDRYIQPTMSYNRCRQPSLSAMVSYISDKQCTDLTDEDVRNVTAKLDRCAPYYLPERAVPKQDCPDALHCHDDPCSDQEVELILRYFTDINFYSYKSANHSSLNKHLSYTLMLYRDRTLNELEYYKENFLGKTWSNEYVKLRSVYISDDQKYDLFSELLLDDAIYFGVAMGLIILLEMLYMFSIALVLATAATVVMSLSMAYAVYIGVMGFNFFPFINILSSLIIIAVGADDVFIIYTTWQRAKDDTPGVVGVSKTGLPLAHLTSVTLSHAAVSVTVTSLTTAAAFFANYVNNVIDIRCFGIFSGLCILCNLFLMVTWMPTVLILSDRVWAYFYQFYARVGNCQFSIWCNAQCKTMKRWMDYFYELFYNMLIDKIWFVWLAILPALGVAASIIVFVDPKLQLPQSSSFQLFPSYDYMEQWDQSMKSEFQFSIDADKDDDVSLYFIWGVKPIDNSPWSKPEKHGSLVFDNTFNISDTESQIWMNSFCESLNHLNYSDGSVTCLIKMIPALAVQCNELSDELPIAFTEECCKGVSVPLPAVQYEKCTTAAASCPLTEMQMSHFSDITFYDKHNVAKVYQVVLDTTQPYTPSYKIMGNFHEEVMKFFNQKISTAPKGLKNGFVVSWDFQFYDLQNSLSNGTYYSIGLSVAVALLVMFATTLNPVITIYAMLTISMAIAVTVAVIVFLGWHLGILESIVINLAVGLSIDFTIHYGVAYCCSKEYASRDKTRDSFMRVGGAVAMAAITTFAAGAAIMPSYILAYRKMGTFLMLVMTISWFYATFFFLSLCRVLAPRGKFCQLHIPWRLCCKKKETLDFNYDQHSLRSVESDDSFMLTF